MLTWYDDKMNGIWTEYLQIEAGMQIVRVGYVFYIGGHYIGNGWKFGLNVGNESFKNCLHEDDHNEKKNVYGQNKEKNSSHVDVEVDEWYDVVHTTPFETITERSEH